MESIDFHSMEEQDITGVVAIEEESFDSPWTANIFRDCLKVGYDCWVFYQDDRFLGYLIFSRILDECHILNFAIATVHRGKGFGFQVMQRFLKFCDENQIVNFFLEVREGNQIAVKLYHKLGFQWIGRRKQYYQVKDGREDAIVMQRCLREHDG